MDGLISEDKVAVDKVFDNPWRGAEAYHFYILAQKQFHQGQLESAVITAIHLKDYEDVLGLAVYHLLALISVHAGYFGTCSKALNKLELTGDYEELALSIFTKHKPVDPEDENAVCSNCLSTMRER